MSLRGSVLNDKTVLGGQMEFLPQAVHHVPGTALAI